MDRLARRIAAVFSIFSAAGLASAAPRARSAQLRSTNRPSSPGGCFWSMQSAFEKAYGVISAVSGYAGGNYQESQLRELRRERARRGRAGRLRPDRGSPTPSSSTSIGATRIRPTRAAPSSTAARSTGRSSSTGRCAEGGRRGLQGGPRQSGVFKKPIAAQICRRPTSIGPRNTIRTTPRRTRGLRGLPRRIRAGTGSS